MNSQIEEIFLHSHNGTNLIFNLNFRCAKGFMHMRIRTNDDKKFMLAQCSKQFDSIPELIRHYCLNRLPIRGAEHVCLLEPVNVSLL